MQQTHKPFFIKQFIYDCICKFGSITNKSVMSELARMQQQGQAQAAMQEQLGQAQAALREQLNQTQEQLRQMQTAMQEQLWQIGQLEQKNNLLEKKLLIYETQNHYSYVRQHIQERLSRGKKLRFASYVIYDSNFGAHGICGLMLKEPEKYDVKFIICPDVYRDMDDLKQYHKTKQAFIDKYGRDSVLDGYDEESGEFLDWSSDFDIVYTANKYDSLVNKVHGINYLCGQELLTVYIEYGMNFFNWDDNIPENTVDSCLYYKYFQNSQNQKRNLIRQRICNVSNIVVSGYPKVDQLAVCKYDKPPRKRILIAPHQTVKGIYPNLQISNFLTYSDFILELPDLFTDIDFVFRPHPLLFKHLVMYKIWTQEHVDEYTNSIQNKRFIYSTESDYFHLFYECDAIIHDCSSFMGEWLFTGKPCCYVIESESAINRQLNEDGKLCLKNHTILADSKEKIIQFIEKVQHNEFETKISPIIKEKIMINYPHASEYVLEHLLD